MNELLLIILFIVLLIVPQFFINSTVQKKKALLIKIITGVLFLVFIWVFGYKDKINYELIISAVVITALIKNIWEYRKNR